MRDGYYEQLDGTKVVLDGSKIADIGAWLFRPEAEQPADKSNDDL
jgi:hypothetical protein